MLLTGNSAGSCTLILGKAIIELFDHAPHEVQRKVFQYHGKYIVT